VGALQLSLGSTTDLFRNLRGGLEEGGTATHLGELSLQLDSEAVTGRPGGILFVLAARADGRFPAGLAGTVHAVSNLAAQDDWYLLEAWYEQRLAAGRSAVLAGVFAVDSEFDARVSAEVFTNGAFGTGLDLSESGAAGPGIFPVTGLGVRLRHSVSPFVTLRLAVVDGAPSAGVRRDQFTLDGDEGAFVISELDYQPAAAFPVRMVLGAWAFSRQQPRLEGEERGDSRGAYAFWEGELHGAEDEGTPRLSSFIRVGMAEQDTSPVELHYSAGLSVHAPLASRPQDTLGLALSRARLSSALPAVSRTESVVELTYAAHIAPWLTLQPVLQYALDPVDAEGRDAVMAGLRIGFSF
jgi:porin